MVGDIYVTEKTFHFIPTYRYGESSTWPYSNPDALFTSQEHYYIDTSENRNNYRFDMTVVSAADICIGFYAYFDSSTDEIMRDWYGTIRYFKNFYFTQYYNSPDSNFSSRFAPTISFIKNNILDRNTYSIYNLRIPMPVVTEATETFYSDMCNEEKLKIRYDDFNVAYSNSNGSWYSTVNGYSTLNEISFNTLRGDDKSAKISTTSILWRYENKYSFTNYYFGEIKKSVTQVGYDDYKNVTGEKYAIENQNIKYKYDESVNVWRVDDSGNIVYGVEYQPAGRFDWDGAFITG